MTTLTIEIPEKAKQALTDLVEKMSGKIVTEKISRKDKEFLKDLDEAVDFVKQHTAGLVKAKTMDQLLNEL